MLKLGYHNIIRRVGATAILCFAFAATAHAQVIRTQLSQTETVVGEPVTLSVVVANTELEGPPKFTPVKGLDIRLSGGPMRRHEEYNGRVTRSDITYTYDVTPRAAGQFTLPAFTITLNGKEHASNRPQLSVLVAPPSARLFMVEVHCSKETAYVGQPVLLTLHLVVKKYSEGGLEMNAQNMWELWRSGAAASSFGVFAQADLNRPTASEERRTDENGNSAIYFVYRIDLTVTPTQRGPFDFGMIEIAYHYPVSFQRDIFGTVRTDRVKRLRETPTLPQLTILPVPDEGRPPDYNGAVGRYRITATARPTNVPVGDPITLSLTIRGNGNLESLSAPRLDRVEALTRDFEIPLESLAGSVVGAEKVFTQTVRARRADVTQIPAIPFSFFDPESGQFSTARSTPIPITVRPAETALPVAPPSPGNGSTPRLAELSEGLEANDDDPARVLASQQASVGPLAWIILGGMPLAYLIASLVQARSSRFRSDVALQRRTGAMHKARILLKEASPQAARSAVLGYIADCCNVPEGGMTRPDALRLLSERRLPETVIQTADAFLAQAEHVSYGGAQTGGEPLPKMAGHVISLMESAGLR